MMNFLMCGWCLQGAGKYSGTELFCIFVEKSKDLTNSRIFSMQMNIFVILRNIYILALEDRLAIWNYIPYEMVTNPKVHHVNQESDLNHVKYNFYTHLLYIVCTMLYKFWQYYLALVSNSKVVPAKPLLKSKTTTLNGIFSVLGHYS